MALGFFRRRQKMVIIIMVVLMVSFLVGFQGFSMLTQTDPAKAEVATTRFGELTRGEFMAAESDLEILRRMGMDTRPWEFGEYYILTRRNGERAREAYALLLREALAAGIQVDDADVDAFFTRLGYAGEDYESFIATLRASSRTWSEAQIRRAVANYLLITKSFAENRVNCPPSDREAAVMFRNMREQIRVRVARVRAEDYLDEVPEPNDARINAHFARYRELLPDQPRPASEMSFGYREPARVTVRYLFVRADVLRRVSEPTFDRVHQYFREHREEFTRQVPASAPAASGPAGGETRTVQMEFPEAKPLVIEKLRKDVAMERVEELVRLLGETHVPQQMKAAGPAGGFAAARKATMRDASKALGRVLRGVELADVPLDEAVASLAEAAGLNGICYPWGTFGDDTLLPSVKVSLRADGITLGEALAKISAQVKWPPEGRGTLRWVHCEGLGNMLFCASDDPNGIDFYPIAVGRTGRLTYRELSEHEVLGYATVNPAGGATLAQVAFTAKGLSSNEQQRPLVEVGRLGPEMYVTGDRLGRLLWLLEEALPLRSPVTADETPELRKRVVRDVKLAEAFNRAVADAEKIRKAGEEIGLANILAARKLKAVETDYFARLTEQMQLPDIPQLGLSKRVAGYVIPKLFSLLVPKADADLSKAPSASCVVPIPATGEVLIVERTGYKPVLRPEYEGFGRLAVAQMIHRAGRQQLELAWFDLNVIRRRVGFSWLKD